jgi:putative lipoprotein
MGMAHGQVDGTSATISGTVAYRQRIALPPEAIIHLRLEDVSRADAPAKIVSQWDFAAEGKQVPIPFHLIYKPSDVVASHRYDVRASITVGGKMTFTSTSTNLVLTQGAPSEVAIMLDQVTPNSPSALVVASTTKLDLEGTYWKLIEVSGKAVTTSPSVREAYVILHANDKTVAGTGGCNRLTGRYDLSGNELHFSALGMTMMACPEPAMQQERAFVELLKATSAYRIQRKELEFIAGDKVVAKFQAQYLK